MNNQLIPERLIAARKVLGLTQKKAAEMCLINQGAYSRYESGERSPKPSTIAHLAATLGTTSEYLIGKTNTSESETITITRNDDPTIFELVTATKKGDIETAQRLLHYYKKMIDKNN